MAESGSRLKKHHAVSQRPPFGCIALLLQGGGALGAYQGGVYQALSEANLHPNLVAGISIGAINASIIAGNPPEARVDKLRTFWETISRRALLAPLLNAMHPMIRGDAARSMFAEMHAGMALVLGAEGFFEPRFPNPLFEPPGTYEATSFYDTGALKSTLETLVDFDRINNGGIRLALGAVNVRSGNFVYFDTETHAIRPKHVMASGALPPGFPPVEIDGEYYWDGGLVSNTPLQWMLEYSGIDQDVLAFQVDLWSARGNFPKHMGDVAMRQKEIQYSSRTRANTDYLQQRLQDWAAVASLLDKLPKEVVENDEVKQLSHMANRKARNIVHLIYRSKNYEGNSRDYDFSRISMEEHWKAGYDDAVRTLRHPQIFERPPGHCRMQTFDVQRDGMD